MQFSCPPWPRLQDGQRRIPPYCLGTQWPELSHALFSLSLCELGTFSKTKDLEIMWIFFLWHFQLDRHSRFSEDSPKYGNDSNCFHLSLYYWLISVTIRNSSFHECIVTCPSRSAPQTLGVGVKANIEEPHTESLINIFSLFHNESSLKKHFLEFRMLLGWYYKQK